MTDLALDLDPNSPTFKDIKLNASGDIEMVDEKTAIVQHILQRLGVYRGEWFLDSSQGLPYFEQILVKNPNQAVIDAIFINAILNVPGVTQLTKYKFAVDSAKRILTISFTCQTTAGIVNYSGLIGQQSQT